MTARHTLCALAFGLGGIAALGAPPASAQPAATTQVKVGDTLALMPADWAKVAWSFGAPNANEAAGKVVIHWFCTPKVEACQDDLARIVTLRENGGVYIVAYLNGTQRQTKSIDPIRESEGVGRGTVANGPGVKKLFKQLGIAKGPWSIVVDVDGKVQAITTSGDINELDSRDQLVKQLRESIKPYTMTSQGPTVAKPAEKLSFSIKIQLASWNSFSQKTPMQFDLTAAKDLVCNTRTITADKMKLEGKTLTAQVTCTAPKGIYQARGELRFGYVSLSGATGLGAEAASWKFEVQGPAQTTVKPAK
jgi:hypothetical protein